MLVEAKLYGRLLGTAEWNVAKGCSVFQYSNEIIKTLEPSPIVMPTEE